jgi:hypothetical protein
MARIITTSSVIIPATLYQPAQIIPKGSCLEVTAAMAAVIAGAGGTTRNVSTMSGTAGHDQLGEAVGVSNSSA